jgi:hypothetical protein
MSLPSFVRGRRTSPPTRETPLRRLGGGGDRETAYFPPRWQALRYSGSALTHADVGFTGAAYEVDPSRHGIRFQDRLKLPLTGTG